ncbi:hypothetical protein SAMN00777080_2840 [Aquiflexum balticum DSM 16537]|uniref:Uncharacterized protein n=1 Tax=Aquiflexum balticum DSM 16537 TaxID=758820 RepID=A0A1W2H5J6_9BACT|nr:hypothetical protein [Aquiflexum balticum]SMD44220.1 hypothetical protein SAMN00777080_2840 [Aquiflexum balticum DSM 16537]
MIKKFLLIGFSILSIGILFYFISPILLVSSTSDKSNVEIFNPKNRETIYLLKTSWGLNGSRMAIGLNTELKVGFKDSYEDKYECVGFCDSPILYKLEQDTLFVYDGNWQFPKEDNFKTPIKIIELKVQERLGIYRNYKSLNLKIFPEDQTYIIENSAKK